MEWGAPKSNFYALYASIRNPSLNAAKALAYFNIRECEFLSGKRKKKLNSSSKKIYIDKDELVELYINQKLTQAEIARIYKVTQVTISTKLREHKIMTRSRGEKKDEQSSFNRKAH